MIQSKTPKRPRARTALAIGSLLAAITGVAVSAETSLEQATAKLRDLLDSWDVGSGATLAYCAVETEASFAPAPERPERSRR